MRLLRLLALVAVVAMVYFAQYIFDHGSLADLFPAWLLRAAPFLWRATRWLPEDLLAFAQWLTVIGLLGFGLLSPLWDGDSQRLFRRMRVPATGRRTMQAAGWVLLGIGLAGAAVVAVAYAQQRVTPADSLRWGLLWVGAMLCYGAAAYVATRGAPRVAYAAGYSQQVRPWSHWPGLVALLAALALLYSFDLIRLPLKVDSATATVAIAASNWLSGTEPWLTHVAGGEGVSSVAYSLTALFTLVVHDALLGARLAGVVAGVTMVAAVWLLAVELFRRSPKSGDFGEILEDDGRWMALLAAMLSGIGLATYHYSRAPYYLEGVALGVMSLWTLVRGLRTDSTLLLGASGLLLGTCWFYGPMALAISLTALVWWGGIWLLERSWLTGMSVAPRSEQLGSSAAGSGATVRVQRGAGWSGFLFWLAGVLVVAAPLIGVWATEPGAWLRHITWQVAGLPGGLPFLDGLWSQLRLAMLGLGLYPDASGMLAYDAHLLPSLLAPLLALAVGALLLNMDSLAGWTVLTWTGMALLGAAFTGPVQPFWPALLPLLPAASLALAFVLDRLRVLLMQVLGTWSLQASVYLVLGIIVAAGLFSWIHFYEVARTDSDLATAVGRGIRERGPDAHVILLNGQANLSGVLAGPVVQMMAQTAGPVEVETIQAGDWPERLPNPVRVLVAPEDLGLIPTFYSRYPGGEWQVIRNLHANPLLYIYDLPPLESADAPASPSVSPLSPPAGPDAAPRDP